MLDVALVTCVRVADGDEDDLVLVDALRRLGLSTEFACWDDPDARWPVAGVAVIRSTWDYHERLDAFLSWADFVSSVTTLRNDAATIRWNAHKGYLLDLAAKDVAVVPTTVVPAGTRHELGEGTFVVKPAVSIGGHRTTRHAVQSDLDAITAVDDALVQPYVEEIETNGEISIVCIDGTPTHAVKKVPALGDFLSHEHLGADVQRIDVDDDLQAFAAATLAALDAVPLYARVDVVESAGRLRLMELELIEPTLWLRRHPPTADVLASAIARQLTH